MGRVELKPTYPTSKVLVISGWRGVGKTTLCQRLADSARLAGWDVAGLISPPQFEGRIKTGIEVEDLRSGTHRLLASLLAGKLKGARLGPWTFDDEQFAWCNQVLLSAVPCDMLVIDEIGPLEFDSGLGWSESFGVIDSHLYHLAIVVIRPEYLDSFLARWPDAEEIVISDPKEVDTLVMGIMNKFIKKQF